MYWWLISFAEFSVGGAWMCVLQYRGNHQSRIDSGPAHWLCPWVMKSRLFYLKIWPAEHCSVPTRLKYLQAVHGKQTLSCTWIRLLGKWLVEYICCEISCLHSNYWRWSFKSLRGNCKPYRLLSMNAVS